MPIQAKICGLKDPESVRAAIDGGAAYLGFNFVEKSPRYLTVDAAGELSKHVPQSTGIVALTVDADDDQLARIVDAVSPSMLQLHGSESQARIIQVKRKFGLPVMKAVPVGGPEDVEIARKIEQSVDWLLFDTKPITSSSADLPGGTGIAFDWQLLHGTSWSRPWMLAGGLTAETVCDAARLTGAQFVDVSSGVESARGQKDPGLIKEFLRRVAQCDGARET